MAGALYDTRDHEFYPSTGMFHEVSLRASPGDFSERIFGGLTLDGRIYQALYGEYLVVAGRLMADLLFGDVPFYELARGGGLWSFGMFGGAWGVRGVPAGRYHGKVKLLGGTELRSMFLRWKAGPMRFRLGVAALLDVGRLWAGYRNDPVLDGEGAGLKYGVGGGIRLLWGETLLIRFDVSYSPDAGVGSSGAPVGFYVWIGQAY